MRLWAWGQSDPGRKRERNEDAYLVDPETGVMAVADGMGGHQGGATASRMAVEYLGREMQEARGDFSRALEAQLRASVRTTEEMPAIDPIMDSGFAPTSPRRIAELAADLETPPPRGEDQTLPAGAVLAFSPALELMRGVVRRASSAIFEAAWAKPGLRGLGTALAALLIHGGRAHLVQHGDPRCHTC